MTRADRRNNRWPLLAAGAFLTIVYLIWLHANIAAMARTEAKLQHDVGRLNRDLSYESTRAQQADAQSIVLAVGDIDHEFVRPNPNRVVTIDLRSTTESQPQVEVARASMGDRVMNALLPSAGARVRPGSK